MEPFIIALIVHGCIGGADVIFNHEIIARIPSLPNSGPEEVLHSARELLFAVLFFSLAWFEWHGAAALFIAAIIAAELIVSTVDQVIELDTRLMPVTERVAHVCLFVNMGIVVTLVGQELLRWFALPMQLRPVDYGMASWVLSVLAVLALAWSVRDGVNAMGRANGKVPRQFSPLFRSRR